jgi:hypothetical protein
MTRAEYATLKTEFVEYRQEVLRKKISAAERKLYEAVFDKFLTKLELSGGVVMSGSKNLTITNALNQIFDEFKRGPYLEIIRQFVGDMGSITAKNAEYFRIVEESSNKISDAKAEATEKLRRQFGINDKGKPMQGGYLDRLVQDNALLDSTKRIVVNGITGQVSLADMQKSLGKFLTGTEKTNGSLTRHLNTYLLDTYQQHDRSTGEVFAQKLGLRAFIYAGGKIKDSRCFCSKNNGKVFTSDEAERWRSELGESCGPIWNESKDGTYVGIIRMGGYGCRHSPDWISAAEAIRRRPELRSVLLP